MPTEPVARCEYCGEDVPFHRDFCPVEIQQVTAPMPIAPLTEEEKDRQCKEDFESHGSIFERDDLETFMRGWNDGWWRGVAAERNKGVPDGQ